MIWQQEPTRGLVEGFSGDFVENIKLGITSSYIQVKQGGKLVFLIALAYAESRT